MEPLEGCSDTCGWIAAFIAIVSVAAVVDWREAKREDPME
jgi:hypothetical protein